MKSIKELEKENKEITPEKEDKNLALFTGKIRIVAKLETLKEVLELIDKINKKILEWSSIANFERGAREGAFTVLKELKQSITKGSKDE